MAWLPRYLLTVSSHISRIKPSICYHTFRVTWAQSEKKDVIFIVSWLMRLWPQSSERQLPIVAHKMCVLQKRKWCSLIILNGIIRFWSGIERAKKKRHGRKYIWTNEDIQIKSGIFTRKMNEFNDNERSKPFWSWLLPRIECKQTQNRKIKRVKLHYIKEKSILKCNENKSRGVNAFSNENRFHKQFRKHTHTRVSGIEWERIKCKIKKKHPTHWP